MVSAVVPTGGAAPPDQVRTVKRSWEENKGELYTFSPGMNTHRCLPQLHNCDMATSSGTHIPPCRNENANLRKSLPMKQETAAEEQVPCHAA